MTAVDPSPPSGSSVRLRAMNTLLAIVIGVLLVHEIRQANHVAELKAQLKDARATLEDYIEQRAHERLQGRRQEIVEAIVWLDHYYRSTEGLQRPDGLWLKQRQEPDAEAIGGWILDVYLNARIDGQSEGEARKAVIAAIETTDEWRRKHQ